MGKIQKVLTTMLGLVFLLLPSIVFAGTAETETMDFVRSVTTTIGIFAFVISIILMGFKFMSVKNAEDRQQAMTGLNYVIVGGLLIGFLSFIVTMLISYRNVLYNTMEITGANTDGSSISTPQDPSNEGFIIRMIIIILNAITQFIEWLCKVAGFQQLNTLFFDANPFSAEQYRFLMKFYWLVVLVSSALIVLMVGRSAIKLMYSGLSAKQRTSTMEEIQNWFYVILLIAVAPWIVLYLFRLFDLLGTWLYTLADSSFGYTNNANTNATAFAQMFGLGISESDVAKNGVIDIFAQSIGASNPLNTAIAKLIYIMLYFKINMVFLVRKYVLGIFFLFTPIAVTMWGIKKDSHIVNVWFGEILTNTSVGFFYAFTFMATMHVFTATGFTGWLGGIIAMYSIPKIADVLRNLLQNYFERLSGVDEYSLANPVLGSGFAMMTGMRNAFTRTFSTGRSYIGSNSNSGGTEKTNNNIDTGFAGGSVATANNPVSPSNSGSSFGGAIPMGGFSSVPASPAGGNINIDRRKTKPDTIPTNPINIQPENQYTGTDFTRKTFAKNMNLLNEGGLAKAGQTLQKIAYATAHDNPAFAMFGHLAGGIMNSLGNKGKLNKAIELTTFERMANDSKYKESFRTLSPVVDKLMKKGQNGLIYDVIKSGDINKLKNAGINVDDNIKTAIAHINSGYDYERQKTLKHLNIDENVALRKIGSGTQQFNRYFQKRNPYDNASEAFIFRV